MSFKFLGVQTYINFYTLAAATVLLMIDRSGIAALCIASSVLHEIGHIAALKIFKTTPKKISFGPGGMKLTDNHLMRKSYKKDIAAALSGPAINIISFIVLYFFWRIFNHHILLMSAVISLVIGLFNLLPVAPLDGGRALHALLCIFSSPSTAEKTVKVLSALTLLPTSTIGFYFLIKSRYNATLLFTSLYLIYLMIKQKD